MSHLRLNVPIPVCTADWAVGSLLRCASIGQGGSGGRQAADPSCPGGETFMYNPLQ